MIWFWHWCVRAPFGVAAAASLACGLLGAVEWALAMPAFTIFLIMADVGHHLGVYAEIRQLRKRKDAGLLLPPSVRAFAKDRDRAA